MDTDVSALAPGISVVVPTYNGEATLRDLVARLEPVLRGAAAQFEVIFVNDGSRDGSWEVIRALAGQFAWVRGVSLGRNFGQQNAVLCGIRAARFDVTITMHDDLQHPPEEIPKLLAKLDEGYDVVYGTPVRRQHDPWRRWASWITRIALRSALGSETARHMSAFRAFRTRVREAFAYYEAPLVFINVLLSWGTSRVTAVPVRHAPRMIGKSNYTIGKLLTEAIDMVTSLSVWPLRLASLLGFGLTLFGVAVLVWVVGRYVVYGGGVPGFPFLASIIAIFSGAQLFALGIMGEYLARMHYRLIKRPHYVISEIVGTTETPGWQAT